MVIKNATKSWAAGRGSGFVLAQTGSRFLFVLLFVLQILGNSQPSLHDNFERRILNVSNFKDGFIYAFTIVTQSHHFKSPYE